MTLNSILEDVCIDRKKNVQIDLSMNSINKVLEQSKLIKKK